MVAALTNSPASSPASLTRFWVCLRNCLADPMVRVEWSTGGTLGQAVAVLRDLGERDAHITDLMGSVPAMIRGDVTAAVTAVILDETDDVEGWQGFESEVDQECALEAFLGTWEGA